MDKNGVSFYDARRVFDKRDENCANNYLYLLSDKNALLGDTAETPMVKMRAEIFIASMACVA